MSLILQGHDGVDMEVDARHRAQRVSQRPLDVGNNGAYRISAVSGLLAATLAAGAPLFSFRWGDATRKCVLLGINASVVVSAAITTAVVTGLEAVVARGFTVAHTGGTPLTIAGNNGKMETGFGSTAAADIRMATTAALGGGTVTLDSQGFGIAAFATGTAIGTPLSKTPLYLPQPGQDHPLVLSQNEGFVIQTALAGPATGSLRLALDIAWAEVNSYDEAGL